MNFERPFLLTLLGLALSSSVMLGFLVADRGSTIKDLAETNRGLNRTLDSVKDNYESLYKICMSATTSTVNWERDGKPNAGSR